MASESKATTIWEGDLESGSGKTLAASGALPEVEVTWAARTKREAGKTSPEELLAAAHASCYSMALANGLAGAGNAPEKLTTTAAVVFVPGEGVKSSHLTVVGKVPGLDADGFEKAADAAGQECPISMALKGNVEIEVEASLQS
jgi:osmotically inducible protein OsmC